MTFEPTLISSSIAPLPAIKAAILVRSTLHSTLNLKWSIYGFVCAIAQGWGLVGGGGGRECVCVCGTGTCQRYRLKDEHCGMLEHENGYCGCGPGLECRSHEVKLNGVNNPVIAYPTLSN